MRCSRFRDGHKSPTQWSRRSSQPSRGGYSQNELTVLNLTSNLDGVTICCGTEEEPELANFTLRVYRKQESLLAKCLQIMNIHAGPPNLQANILIRTVNDTRNVLVDLDSCPAAFPKPTLFKVEKFGKPLSYKDGITIMTNFTVVFHKIVKEHAGTYVISVANYHLKKKTKQVGLATTNITLDVLCKYSM